MGGNMEANIMALFESSRCNNTFAGFDRTFLADDNVDDVVVVDKIGVSSAG